MNIIAIIGGGAAGMMAAAVIAESGKDKKVYLIERNKRLGYKVLLSGGGRCNVTTGLTDLKEILTKYPRGGFFLRTAMYNFPPKKLCEWIEAHHVPLKTEKDSRVFPKSDNGKDIVGIFEKIISDSGIEILLGKVVKDITKKNGKFIIGFSNGEKIESDKVILTTGGQAYQTSGSVGDGYKFAKVLGHKITELRPSLSAFLIKEKWVKELPGVSFKKVHLRLSKNKKYEFTGPILFTHKGVTGPAVFALSSLSAYEDFAENDTGKLFIDFVPDKSYENLYKEFYKLTEKRDKLLKVLAQFVPKSVAGSFFEQKGINLGLKVFEARKKVINSLVEILKNRQINITGICAGEEFVTAGGVDLSEVNPKTMESKICLGLYFAGEILDVDGFTGGFNLQAAWATGRLAGENIG